MTMRRPRVGLALGSGAARGWAHIGIIDALVDAGIEPDIVSGSSMGALVGGAFVTGRLGALEDWVHTISWRQIVNLLDFKLSGGGLIGGVRLMRFLRDFYEDTTIESLAKPFTAVATDLMSGREVWFRDGSLLRAVRASIAVPGLFSPEKIGETWFVDGGLVNPVPISPCRAMDADIVIAVNLNSDLLRRGGLPAPPARAEKAPNGENSARRTRGIGEISSTIKNEVKVVADHFLGSSAHGPGYFDVVLGAIGIMEDRITRSRMAGEPPDVLLNPRLAQIGVLEFNRAEEAIAEGHNCVRRMLPALKHAIGRTG